MITDNELMIEVKNEDFEKLGILFERYKKLLFGYFFRMTYNREISEDLVQNVFMRILKYRNNFQGYGKFTTWMYRIAHNVSMDHFKKQTQFKIEEDYDIDAINDNSDFSQNLIINEELSFLKKVILKMAPVKREILLLSKIKGLKYKEIAKILNCSESAVKVGVFRAMKDLKKIYSNMEEKENEKRSIG